VWNNVHVCVSGNKEQGGGAKRCCAERCPVASVLTHLDVVIDSEVGEGPDCTVLHTSLCPVGLDGGKQAGHGAVGRCLLPVQVMPRNQVRDGTARAVLDIDVAAVVGAKSRVGIL
jgi:hypothetical protein